jgi:hypothetical protein
MRKWFVLLAALAWPIVTAKRRRDRREYASHRVPPAALPKRPVGERRAALRLIVYIGIPLLGLLASILAGERLLTIEPSPDERGRDYALGFNVDGGATLGGYANLLRSLALANVKYREQPLEESAATQITVAARHCDQTVTVYGRIQLDARWLAAVRATRLHQPLVVHSSPLPRGQTFVIKSPNVGGRFAFAVTGAVSNFAAQLVTERINVPVHATYYHGDNTEDETILTGVIPDRELTAVRRIDLNGDQFRFEFRAPWITRRGFQSCYLSLPRLINDPVVAAPFGAERLIFDPAPIGPAMGRTEVETTTDSVDLQDTNPAPDIAGLGRSWNCTRHEREDPSAATVADCHATVVLMAPNQAARLQLLVLLVAALLSGTLVALAGGVRRLLPRVD